MDSEWLLRLSEHDQITIAEVVSSQEQGLMCAPTLTDEFMHILGGGVRGGDLAGFGDECSDVSHEVSSGDDADAIQAPPPDRAALSAPLTGEPAPQN